MKTASIMTTFGMTLAIAAMFVVSGCRHREFDTLDEDTVQVRVVYDWSNAPDADPAGMCVQFYNSLTGECHRFDFRGKDGGTISLPQGRWHIITYNNDTEGVLFDKENLFHEHLAYTREGDLLEGMTGNGSAAKPPRYQASASEKVVITPDMLWGVSRENHNLRLAQGEKEHVLTLVPEEMVCTYTYEIRDIQNLDKVTGMCATLSGMAGQMTLHGGALPTECVTLPLATKLGATDTAMGHFYTFGHHPSNNATHRMCLYVWMQDGRKLVYGSQGEAKWDVTSQIESAPDPRHVHIVISGLDIPVEIDEGAFTTTTDDWNSVDYTLGI